MALSIYTLLQSALLIINAIAILNEDRLLRRYGWARNQLDRNEEGFKARTLDLIHSVQTVMRIPLLFVNTLVIIIKIVL